LRALDIDHFIDQQKGDRRVRNDPSGIHLDIGTCRVSVIALSCLLKAVLWLPNSGRHGQAGDQFFAAADRRVQPFDGPLRLIVDGRWRWTKTDRRSRINAPLLFAHSFVPAPVFPPRPEIPLCSFSTSSFKRPPLGCLKGRFGFF